MSAGIELERYHERGLEVIGGRAFSRDVDPNTKDNYEQIRDLARAEVELRKNCMRRAHEAYENGDGATAKQLSNEGKEHAAKADELFLKASKLAFEKNNENSLEDTIDLHGQYVQEAEQLLRKRISKDQRKGKTHLHVIVGKGIHSVDHAQRLKPAIEDLCRDLGLQCATEENAGRIYVNLQGHDITEIPPAPQHRPHHQQQHSHASQNQEEQPYEGLDAILTKLIKKVCCTVM